MEPKALNFLEMGSFVKEGVCAPVAQWLEQQPCKL